MSHIESLYGNKLSAMKTELDKFIDNNFHSMDRELFEYTLRMEVQKISHKIYKTNDDSSHFVRKRMRAELYRHANSKIRVMERMGSHE